MQPDSAAGWGELGCILKQIRNDPLKLGRIKRKLLNLIIRQKIKGKPFLLKPRGPEATDLGKAGIDVAALEPHFELAGFKHTEAEEILDIALQPLSVRVHVPQNLALL